MSAWLGALARLALGERCPACGDPAAGELLCAGCWRDLPRWRGRLCGRCLMAGADPSACSAAHHWPVWAPLVWDERVAAMIHALKYQARRRLVAPLAGEMAAALARDARWDLVVAVPLHAARERERGYNQAEWLARALAPQARAPWVPGLLRRVRPTASQTGLRLDARRENVRCAFRVEAPAAVCGRRVLLVDDVLTTGATLQACAEALAAAGAHAAAATVAWVR